MYQTKTSWLLAIVIVVFSLAALSSAFARTWKSSSGTYTVEADFVKFENNEVSLRKTNGIVIQVPISRLCTEDQVYIKNQTSSKSESPTTTTTASSLPAKQWTYQKLVQSAHCLRNASEVLRLYKMFLLDKNITDVDRKAAEKELSTWEDRAKKKMVRIGFRWLTPEEAKNQKLQAHQLVAEARRLIDVDQFDVAISKLHKASKVDKESLEADFWLGLGYAILGCDAEKANRHFTECIQRDPQHISALNNLALTEVRLGKYARALSHWRMALELAPASPEAIQNLGRLVHLSQQRRLQLPSQIESQFADLYAAACVKVDAEKFKRRIGWLYMRYYSPFGEKVNGAEKEGGKTAKPSSSTRIMTRGSGTGFVVHPEYILTNHHVVKGGTEFLVISPNDRNRALPATVVGVAGDIGDGGFDDGISDDFAVIHCKGLTAPPVSFVEPDLVPRKTKIVILGFPGALQGQLISTPGTITELPTNLSNRYMMDAVSNGGNSGGPVCDMAGNVLAVHVAGRKSKDILPKHWSSSIPHSRALPLLEKCIPNYKQLPSHTEVKDFVEVYNFVGRSTVSIQVMCPSSSGGIVAKSKTKKSKSKALEDFWCMRCSGCGKTPCPNPKCRKGNVNVKRTVVEAIDPATGRKLYGQKFFPSRCPTCNGKGFVPCPDCNHGIDKSLL